MNNRVDNSVVLNLLGGKWPEVKGYQGFCWDAISHFVIENSMLIPVDTYNNPIPGPTLILEAIENPF